MIRAFGLAVVWAAAVMLVSGCEERVEAPRLRIAINWKPEPEFGGLYEAQRSELFKLLRLPEVEVIGGPGAPVIQMVAGEQATFGIVSADELVIARSKGEDMVAVFATYQTCPQGLMVHKSRGLTSLAQVFESGTLAMEPGLPYVKFIEARYGFGKVKVVPYNFSIAPFMADKQMAQQCFVFSEPIAARRQGVEPQVFLIADSGYNPYTAVIVMRGAVLRERRNTVRLFVEALRNGWDRYLTDPAPTNAYMARLNPEMDAETFALAAEAQKPLVVGEARHVGEMTAARWAQLIEQLYELKIIHKRPAAEDCFVDIDPR